MAERSIQQTSRDSEIGGVFTRLAGSSDKTVMSGRVLRAVRAVVLVVFGIAIIVYTIDLFALWDETHRLQYDSGSYGETQNFFGLTMQERQLLTGSITDTPGWYPVFVITRQVIIDVVSIGVAWLIFSRRPRHWMAYLATLFILLAPIVGQLNRDVNRLDGTLAGPFHILLAIVGALTLVSFLWLFPDGRFRGVTTWLVGTLAGLLGLGILMTLAGQDDPESAGVFAEVVNGIWWMSLMAVVLVWMVGGIALQIWRYRRTPIEDRRLARWNLVFLVAVPLWFFPSEALHDSLSDSDVGRYSVSGFVWEQIHESLYLMAPVLLGLWVLFLVRRQGWWDFQTLWNRTAVYGIGLVLLAAVYGGVIGVVTLAASPLSATAEQVVAVLAATAAVAFAYGPLLGRVRHWVDTRWFPRRAEVDALALAFSDEVRASSSPASVPDRLRAVLRDELDPQHVELWTVAGAEGERGGARR